MRSSIALGLLLSLPLHATLVRGDNSQRDFQWAWTKDEVAQAKDGFWPQYRGPLGTGHADPSAKPPVEWGEDKNLAWKRPLDGKAWSSPIVWNDRIFLTNATVDGLKMSVHCLNRADGRIIWERVVFTNQETQPDFHAFNSYASPTPIVDGKHLFVSFGAYGTACLEATSGETLWERRDLPCNHYRGAGSSPIFFENLLIFPMDGFDQQYIVALDRTTGKTVWKTNRSHDFGTENGDFKKAYGTPHVIRVNREEKSELQLLSPAAKAIFAYEPATGRELWHVIYDEHSAAVRPLFDGTTVYASTGFSKGKLLAISPTGQGDVSKSHTKWQATKSIGAKPSPLMIDNRIVSLEDKGMLSAFDKTTGETLWQIRLGGDFSSSPIYADGKIYCLDEKGNGHVVSPEGKVLAVNALAEGCLASPIAVGRDLIIRTRDAVYCFRN
jgi:outer membrane protein assembly factor BamB